MSFFAAQADQVGSSAQAPQPLAQAIGLNQAIACSTQAFGASQEEEAGRAEPEREEEESERSSVQRAYSLVRGVPPSC